MKKQRKILHRIDSVVVEIRKGRFSFHVKRHWLSPLEWFK